jgi:hypothetical protein
VSDKENTKYFTDTKKCGVEKIAQRRLRRLQFFVAQNARTGHFAVTVASLDLLTITQTCQILLRIIGLTILWIFLFYLTVKKKLYV